jgi:hypothetical protein
MMTQHLTSSSRDAFTRDLLPEQTLDRVYSGKRSRVKASRDDGMNR